MHLFLYWVSFRLACTGSVFRLYLSVFRLYWVSFSSILGLFFVYTGLFQDSFRVEGFGVGEGVVVGVDVGLGVGCGCR